MSGAVSFGERFQPDFESLRNAVWKALERSDVQVAEAVGLYFQARDDGWAGTAMHWEQFLRELLQERTNIKRQLDTLRDHRDRKEREVGHA